MVCDAAALGAAADEYRLTHIVAGGDSGRDFDGRLPGGGCPVPVTLVGIGSTGLFVQADHAVARLTVLALLRQAVEQAKLGGAVAVDTARPEPWAVVLGGGAAGLLAARVLAENQFETHVVEAADTLGGWLAKRRGPEADWVKGLAEEVAAQDHIRVHRSTELSEISGQPGQYRVTLQSAEGTNELTVGAIVVATGAQAGEKDAPETRPGSDVVTQDELETLIWEWRRRGTDAGNSPGSIVMLQCAGTRNEARPYCSKTCCTQALRNALEIRSLFPQSDVTVVYRDIVTPGLAEEFYRRAREAGVHFVRRGPAEPRIEAARVQVDDVVLGGPVTLPADLVVQSTGVVPYANTKALAARLGVGIGSTGFFEPVNIKSQGMDLPRPGMYLAGLAGGPASVEEVIEQGMAAGLRAALYLRRPRRTAAAVASVNERICSGCGLCVEVCPVDARRLDPDKGVAVVDRWLCAGCGTCVAACPNGASNQALYEAQGVLAALDAAID